MKPEALFPYAYPVSNVTFNEIIHSREGASPPHSLVLHSHSYHEKPHGCVTPTYRHQTKSQEDYG